MKEINTIIFDIGKVLIDYDWKKFALSIFDDDEILVDKMMDAMYGHGVWDELDRGVWTIDQLIDGFLQYEPSLEKEFRKYLEESAKALIQFPFTKTWLHELKERGYQLLFLSNYSHHMMDRNPECLDFLPLMDGGIFSCDVKLIKPNPEIFKLLIEQYNLTPSKCVFLDDKSENVNTAISLDFNGIVVTDHDSASKKLEDLLG